MALNLAHIDTPKTQEEALPSQNQEKEATTAEEMLSAGHKLFHPQTPTCSSEPRLQPRSPFRLLAISCLSPDGLRSPDNPCSPLRFLSLLAPTEQGGQRIGTARRTPLALTPH